MSQQPPTSANSQAQPGSEKSKEPQAIDLKALAERVLHLLKEESRLELERKGGRHR